MFNTLPTRSLEGPWEDSGEEERGSEHRWTHGRRRQTQPRRRPRKMPEASPPARISPPPSIRVAPSPLPRPAYCLRSRCSPLQTLAPRLPTGKDDSASLSPSPRSCRQLCSRGQGGEGPGRGPQPGTQGPGDGGLGSYTYTPRASAPGSRLATPRPASSLREPRCLRGSSCVSRQESLASAACTALPEREERRTALSCVALPVPRSRVTQSCALPRVQAPSGDFAPPRSKRGGDL